MSTNPNDLRDIMSRAMEAAVRDDAITDSEADELEVYFERGLGEM